MKQAFVVEIDTAEIARMLGVKRRYATNVITKRADFPRPVTDLSQKIRRWDQRQVLEWMKRRTERRIGIRR